jgi:hypothetical protein
MSFPSTTTPYTLPESVEASYAPRTLLGAFNHGIKRTYFYELLDEVSSPAYGLLNSDLTPKPAFNALKNLISVLSDPATGTLAPASLQYSVSGGDSTLNHLLLQKQDGSFWLVLWLEQSSWNPVTSQPVSVNPQNITIELTSSYQATRNYQFDSNGNATAFNQSMNDNSTSLTVTDQVSIVQIVPR